MSLYAEHLKDWSYCRYGRRGKPDSIWIDIGSFFLFLLHEKPA
jgi:hypothetical protein